MSAIGGIVDFQRRDIDFDSLYKMKLAMSMRGRRRSSAYLGGSVNIIYNDDGLAKASVYEEMQPAIFKRGSSEYAVAVDSEHSDASSVFEAYRVDGFDFLATLCDSFALCLFDGEKNMLILARDRRGNKPMFYKLHKGKIYFSSEIKGISEAIGERLTVDRDMLSLHLSAPLGVYGACDIFKDIQEVMPGECVIFGELGVSRFRYGARRNYEDFKVQKKKEKSVEIITPYPAKISQNIDEVLSSALIAFDYPQFDADMPALCSLLESAQSRSKNNILFEDRTRRQSFAYAREREDRLGAFYGIRAKGRYISGRKEDNLQYEACRQYLLQSFCTLDASRTDILKKILGEKKLEYLRRRFESGSEKQRDTDAQIRILGMLIQTVMWTESKGLIISHGSDALISLGFQ